MILLFKVIFTKIKGKFKHKIRYYTSTNVDNQFRSIMEMINDPEQGTPDDKLRLFLIYYLCTGTKSNSCMKKSYSYFKSLNPSIF